MSNYDIAKEVIAGQWGNGDERRTRLTAAGYDYTAVQTIVNSLLEDGYPVQDGRPEPAPAGAAPEMLEVDYDPKTCQGIIINIIV